MERTKRSRVAEDEKLYGGPGSHGNKIIADDPDPEEVEKNEDKILYPRLVSALKAAHGDVGRKIVEDCATALLFRGRQALLDFVAEAEAQKKMALVNSRGEFYLADYLCGRQAINSGAPVITQKGVGFIVLN